MMAKIWANRLIDCYENGGEFTWASVPNKRKASVKAELKYRVANGDITAEEYEGIVGEAYTE